MDTVFEAEMFKSESSTNKRNKRVASGDGNVPKKRKKVKSSRKILEPLGEMARREEERLKKLVLGDGSDLLHDASELPSCSYSSPMQDSGVEEGDYDNSPQMSDTLASPERTPAWVDEDDTNICVEEAMGAQGRQVPNVINGGTSSDPYVKILKHKFESTVGTPTWARLDHRNSKKSSSSDDDDSDSENELLRRCGNFLSTRPSSLRKTIIQIKRMRDLNHDTYSEGPVIKAVEFHPSSMVGLVAGLSGIASLFQVDGRSNTKLHSILFENYPISCARFTPSGEQFIVGSQHHKFFHTFDMMVCQSTRGLPRRGLEITKTKNFEISPDGKLIALCGRFGNIHLLSINTLEGVGQLKMNSEVSAVTFDNNGSRLYSHGEGGEVYAWDIGSRRCIGRFIDDGCIWGRSLAVAPGGRLMACGARSGVVNLYETEGLIPSGRNAPTPLTSGWNAPKPVKILQKLTTAVTCVKFNSSAEILAMASDEKYNAVKLVHFPSMTVFSNFPGSTQSALARPQCLNFSPGSGYLAIGNNKNTALLYRLKHYGNY